MESHKPEATMPDAIFQIRTVEVDLHPPTDTNIYTIELSEFADSGVVDAEIGFSKLPFSEALRNPQAELNFFEEAIRFFDIIEQKNPVYFRHLNRHRDSLGQPMYSVEGLRCAVAIPVAAHQESANIYRTLEQYANQSLSADQFEIVLFLNYPNNEDNTDSNSINTELTVAEIEKFKLNYPHISVRYFTEELFGDLPAIGEIRSDLWNVLGYDLLMRGREEDLMILTHDADTADMDPQYLEKAVEVFEEGGCDAVVAKLRWQIQESLDDDHIINRYLNFYSYVLSLSNKDRRGRFAFTEANCGLSLATFLAVGGFNRSEELGEVQDVMRRIRLARGGGVIETTGRLRERVADTWLTTSSRRILQAMALGYGPDFAWKKEIISFGPNDELRTSNETLLLPAVEENIRRDGSEWLIRYVLSSLAHLDWREVAKITSAAQTVLQD